MPVILALWHASSDAILALSYFEKCLEMNLCMISRMFDVFMHHGMHALCVCVCVRACVCVCDIELNQQRLPSQRGHVGVQEHEQSSTESNNNQERNRHFVKDIRVHAGMANALARHGL